MKEEKKQRTLVGIAKKGTDLIIITKQIHLLMKLRYWYNYVDVKSGILGFSSREIYYVFSFNGFFNNGFLIIPSNKTCELKETPRERERGGGYKREKQCEREEEEEEAEEGKAGKQILLLEFTWR